MMLAAHAGEKWFNGAEGKNAREPFTEGIFALIQSRVRLFFAISNFGLEKRTAEAVIRVKFI